MASTGAFPSLRLRFHSEIDHHDPVFLDDADEEEDADNGDDGQIVMGYDKGKHGAHTCRRQGRNDGDGVHVALVEHAQHDVNRQERRKDEKRLVRQRCLEGLGRACEIAPDARRYAHFVRRLLHLLYRVP